ncbi:cobalamin-dependent protein [Maribacter sp.]|uniref:cobalamin-dependent protein n=1 Tax=Maribacter sp. TaxID=1897614 RepID=UPI0025BC81AC|nr:cobalamin-dependent protein [Maribacter sp.]
MNEQRLDAVIKKALETQLPEVETLLNEANEIAKGITIGRTAFFDYWDVSSEAEFKIRSIKEGRIMYHAHIGMGNWQLTEEALAFVHQEATNNGITVDRAGLCLDRRMGLPQNIRANIPAETGPLLETFNDWNRIGKRTPIQPHMGDFMIGFPASTTNTINALKAGVTTIGNLSQFFAHEAPGWHDQVTTAIETTKSIAILGALKNKGVMFHSYLEDGYGALFFDCTTVAGWAYLEKYIVEDLLNAKLSHCIGGLTSDPIKRSGWVFALDEIHEQECIGSMFYGDTISYTRNFDVNRGLVSEYLLWDIMTQLKCPTGHAVLPLPVTEAVRAPSKEEIVEAQILGHRIEETARRLVDHVDFSSSHIFARKMVKHGKQVFKNALHGLKEAGVDIKNPLQLLYVLKQMGPAVFEEMFGAGALDKTEVRNREILIPTDIFEQSKACYKDNLPMFSTKEIKNSVKDKCFLIASTDVHEHAVMVLKWLLSNTGAEIIYMGAECNPEEIVEQVKKKKIDAILISTHNGMALDYANMLKEKMAAQNLDTPVLFGGVLNQKIPNKEIPVDVTKELIKIGFYPSNRLGHQVQNLMKIKL